MQQVAKKQPASRNIRYWVLAISLILSYLLGVAAFEFVSPISMVHRGIVFGIGFAWAAALIIFLFDLFVLKNGWCGHICPLGGFYSLVGRYSLIRVDHNHENCTNCRKCIEVCPENQVLFMINKDSDKKTKAGFIAVIGRPNAGKSSLSNWLLSTNSYYFS